jgi:hypothetical protein
MEVSETGHPSKSAVFFGPSAGGFKDSGFTVYMM